jgi:hypothetical protein
VFLAPVETHWHGAMPAGAMSHIAIAQKPGWLTVTRLEPVTDEQYGA